MTTACSGVAWHGFEKDADLLRFSPSESTKLSKHSETSAGGQVADAAPSSEAS